jgi:hypothetical protein
MVSLWDRSGKGTVCVCLVHRGSICAHFDAVSRVRTNEQGHDGGSPRVISAIMVLHETRLPVDSGKTRHHVLRRESETCFAHSADCSLLGNIEERPPLRGNLQPHHGFRQAIRADELNGFGTDPEVPDPSKHEAPYIPVSGSDRVSDSGLSFKSHVFQVITR